MSDTAETREVTFEEALVNRMAQRLGMLQTQLEMAQLNVEMRDQEIARLTQQLEEARAMGMEWTGATPPPIGSPIPANGDSTVSTEGATVP